jgi:site-specific recombinase XerD
VEHITETTIAKYVAHRHSKEKKSSTINRELAVLRAALKQAKKHKAIKELPEMPRYDEDNTRMVFF